MQNHFYGLIMAGGNGTRLYPRSRESNPKQFQKLIGDKSLLQQSWDRVKTVIDPENIYVSTNQKYISIVKRQLPDLPSENIITEPAKRNTAPAYALCSAIIAQKDPEALIINFQSDSFFLKPENFAPAAKIACQFLQKRKDALLIIGCMPASPNTGIGYIERGQKEDELDRFPVYEVSHFVEKPNYTTAKKYVRSGKFYWNGGGLFLWQAKHFLSQVEKYTPEIHERLTKIMAEYGKKSYQKTLLEEYSKFPDMPIEPSILEKSKPFFVIPADLDFSDIGTWDSVAELAGQSLKDESGNYSEAQHIQIDTHNSLIISDDPKKLIATVGLNNIIIVDTPDAILVMEKGRGQEVKKIVEELRKRKMDELL